MTIVQLFKIAFFRIPDLKFVKKAEFSNVIVFLLSASVLIAVSMTINVLGVFRDVQADGQKIGESIPDFTIENGKLATAPGTQGFIYQTDSIIFTFDPDGNRTPADIASDVTGSVIAVALLKDQLVIRIPSSGLSTSMLDSNQLEFDYSEPALRNLNGQAIREALSNQAIPWLIKLIVFFVALYPSFVSLLITLVMGTFIATIYTRLKRFSYTFFENLKILIVSAALPTLISVIVQLLLPSFDATTFILFGSLFLFTQGVKQSPKIQFKT